MKNFFSFCFFFIPFCFYGQNNYYLSERDLNEKRFAWGYFLGLNHFNFDLQVKKENLKNQNFFIESKGGIGFHGGLMIKIQIHRYFELVCSPGLYFLSREIYFSRVFIKEKESPLNIKIKSTYLEFPLDIKFFGDHFYVVRPFLGIGGGYIINLESDEKKAFSSVIFPMKTHNFNWQIEGGVEFYFSYFKLIFSLKNLVWTNNEFIKNRNYSKNLKTLKTKAILFSLKFE